ANALALDVLRYLHGEPILAGPPSASYRLRKFVKRHRAPLLATALVFLALLGGIIGTTVGLVRADDAGQDAREQSTTAVLALQREAAERTRADSERDDKEKARALAADNEKQERKAQEAESKAKEEVQKRLQQVQKANHILASIFHGLNPRAAVKDGPPLLDQL